MEAVKAPGVEAVEASGEVTEVAAEATTAEMPPAKAASAKVATRAAAEVPAPAEVSAPTDMSAAADVPAAVAHADRVRNATWQ